MEGRQLFKDRLKQYLGWVVLMCPKCHGKADHTYHSFLITFAIPVF